MRSIANNVSTLLRILVGIKFLIFIKIVVLKIIFYVDIIKLKIYDLFLFYNLKLFTD